MEKVIYPEVKKKMDLNGEKNKDIAKDITSAIKKQNQTLSTFPVSDNKYAEGKNTNNCLEKETIIL